MSTHIKKLLSPFLQSQKDWKLKLLTRWETIMGSVAQHATIEKIYDDTIIIGVYDSCWLQELYLLSPTLLQTINQSLDQPRIKQIRFKQTSKKIGKTREAPVEYTKTQHEIALNRSEELALSRIKDPTLKDALRSFLIRCHREKK